MKLQLVDKPGTTKGTQFAGYPLEALPFFDAFFFFKKICFFPCFPVLFQKCISFHFCFSWSTLHPGRSKRALRSVSTPTKIFELVKFLLRP